MTEQHKKCPLFNLCGGCKYDWTANDYHEKKCGTLRDIPTTAPAIWIDGGTRRRADFCFANGHFGFFSTHSKDVISVTNCPNLVPEINSVLPQIAKLPWTGAGSCLITACDNGIDITINSTVPYYSQEFKNAIQKLNIIRATWNNQILVQNKIPNISFENTTVNYPSGAFLQPTVPSENIIRKMVVDAAHGYKHIADLFCGLGNFTYELNADGFDINGIGVNRDLFINPLTVSMLNKYDCVVMDPPRAGADAQCRQLNKSNVSRVIYVSCNPITFKRDVQILSNGGYKIIKSIPVDQFVGSTHWEIFAVFDHQ